MSQKKTSRWSMALALAVLLLSFGVVSAANDSPARPLPTLADLPGSGGRTFPETGRTVRGVFLDYWDKNGGLAQQGYPISSELQEKSDLNGKTYTVQYFERAVFEYHPENQPPYDVLLSQLGTFRYKEKYPSGGPGGQVSQPPGPAVQKTLCTATHDDSDIDSGAGFVPQAPEQQSVGKGLVLTGSVLSSTDCTPIAGAKIEMRPEVVGQHPDSQRATLYTDASGKYRFESPFPEHIHMRISARDFTTIIANRYHTSPGRSQDSFDVVLVPDPSCTQFSQTGQSLCGTFLGYWQSHGGLAQQGYPISGGFSETSDLNGKTYTVQYFERTVFEFHPENQPPYNVLLSQLGTFRYGAKYSAQIPANTPLNDFYEKAFLNLLLRDPENFTSVGLPKSYYPSFRPNKLTNVTDAYLHDTNALVKQYLAQLRSYDPKTQTPQQVVSTAIMEWHLDNLVRGPDFMYDDYIVNPVTGVQNSVLDLLNNLQPLANKQDADDYISRLNDVGTKFDGVLEQLRIRTDKGIFMPRWMTDETIGQMRSFVSQEAKSNELYTNFKLRVDALTNISASDRQALYTSAEKAINDTVYPAYQKLIDYMTQIEPKGRTTDGVWALPNGDAYYRYAIHNHTTTDMTPEEIHNLGLSEVARVRSVMRSILDGMGYKDKSFGDAMNAARQASGIYHLNSQADKDRLVADFRALIDKANKGVADLFDLKPKIGLEVRAVPPNKEAGSPGGFYFAPALDGSRPGIFYVNLGRPTYVKLDMPTLAYHEAIPGHHFQLGIQTELTGVPTFQKSGVFPFSTGYTEGWALYAEQLAYEIGFYKDDPYGNLGRLQAELFRSARLVVDTGIHWKHWTREQAIAYMDDTLGTQGGAYTSEVERYIAWPAQALGYKIGQLKILSLRDKAQKALGSKFDFKEFHDVVLRNGTMPLATLETVVNNYIASKK